MSTVASLCCRTVDSFTRCKLGATPSAALKNRLALRIRLLWFQLLGLPRESSDEFDEVPQRVKDEGIPFWSGPRWRTDGEINQRHQGRGFYFDCENGHIWEVITHTYVTDLSTRCNAA